MVEKLSYNYVWLAASVVESSDDDVTQGAGFKTEGDPADGFSLNLKDDVTGSW